MRTVDVDRAKAAIYWKKSSEFASGMRTAGSRGDWNAAGTAGVHAAISASDALAVFYFGIRSRDADHESAALLLQRLELTDAAKQVKLFKEIIRTKNLLEYEARLIGVKEAHALLKKVENFRDWAAKGLQGIPKP